MRVDNPLSRNFLANYPSEAARVLEHIAVDDASAFLSQSSVELIAPIFLAMLPIRAADCLAKMEAAFAAKALMELPVNRGARIYNLLDLNARQEMNPYLTRGYRNRLHQIREYEPMSVGEIMDPKVCMLFDNLTVSEAIRQIERYQYSLKCEVYIVDEDHRLKGVLDLGKMMISNRHLQLKDIMNRSVRSISASVNIENILSHPDWLHQKSLPVVDRENILIGVVYFAQLKNIITRGYHETRDPMESIISIAGLYGLSLIQLLESAFSLVDKRKGR